MKEFKKWINPEDDCCGFGEGARQGWKAALEWVLEDKNIHGTKSISTLIIKELKD